MYVCMCVSNYSLVLIREGICMCIYVYAYIHGVCVCCVYGESGGVERVEGWREWRGGGYACVSCICIVCVCVVCVERVEGL